MKDLTSKAYLVIALVVGGLFGMFELMSRSNEPNWSGSAQLMLNVVENAASAMGATLDSKRCQHFARKVPLIICQLEQRADRRLVIAKLEGAGWRFSDTAVEDNHSVDNFVGEGHRLRVTWHEEQRVAARLTVYGSPVR